MNIFYLDSDPTVAAKAMTNKHVVKMIVESAQILSTVHRYCDGKQTVKLTKSGQSRKTYNHPRYDEKLYKSTHVNHPSVVWTRESVENYAWLYNHFCALVQEYENRYGKQHQTFVKLGELLKTPPKNIPGAPMTKMKLAISNKSYHRENPVSSYRAYYHAEKLKTVEDKNRFEKVLYERK